MVDMVDNCHNLTFLVIIALFCLGPHLSSKMGSDDEGNQSFSDSEAPRGGKRKPKNAPQTSKKAKYEPISNDNAKKTNKNKHKPPTVEELNDLKMTENLYNSSLFRLQIEELIKEVAVKNKRKKAFNVWLELFKEALNNMPQQDVILSDKKKFASIFGNKYKRPLKCDQNLSLKLYKPESIKCFGLYDNNALAGPNLRASVNVIMSRTCFHVKDFLNNRYLVKRFYYLLYIAKNIEAHEVKVIDYDGNVLLPILLVQPTEDQKLIVDIHCTPSESYFKPSRFLPNQNNVKQDLYECGISDIETLKVTPTVLYNSALAFDVTLSENSEFVKSVLVDHEHVQEGIKLLCIWLKQRELDVGFGAFTSSLVMYLVTYMLSKKKLNKFMSSYQVIRNFWSFVSILDLKNNPISLSEGGSENAFALFKQHFGLIFLDKTGCYNLAAFLDANVFERFKSECLLALKHLDDNKSDSFHSLFLTQLPFALQYDLTVEITEAMALKDQFICTDEEKAKNIGFEHALAVNHLSDLLKRGLNKRILNIVPRVEIEQAMLKRVFFGIHLNPETAFNFIELGPELSRHSEADEFRKFWGHLSSDRRFRDGSSHVAVYFKTSTIRGKRSIIKRIIKYLLMEKVDIKFTLHYDELEDVLINRRVVSPYPVGTNEESSLKIITLADELGQKLRSVQMSLSITGIQGISDAFSYSQPFPPIAASYSKPPPSATEIKRHNIIFPGKKLGMSPKYIEPLELVLQLEHSSKWPNNLEAIRHIKTSFYVEISKMLEKEHNIISNVTRDYIEVLYEGLVFRYRLYVTREIGLMKKELTESGSAQYMETAESEQYERRLGILPKVNAALKGLQLQFPSFGPGTALIKRWLRSHMIDDSHLPDVVINLLNASLYVNATSFQESCTPQISFFRFLKFIAELQWELQPVLVNFNEEISKEDVTDLESKFQQNRQAVQPLYIIMPYDQGQSLFTRQSPSKEVLGRVRQLAEATLCLVTKRIMEATVFEWKDLFSANIEGYDLLIHLRPLLNPRRHEQLDNTGDSKIVLEKYEQHKNEKIPIVGFNPVDSYLRTLRENYGEFATFFHDPYGGSTVGVLWNPGAKEVKEFKVSNVNGRKLKDNKLILNEDAIIEDFYILGKGIVKWIEKR